jgi:UDP-glucose 4-epimerase
LLSDQRYRHDGPARRDGCSELSPNRLFIVVTIYDEAQYLPFDEGHPIAPTNLYGLTKAMTEGVSRGWIATHAQRIGSAARIFQPGGRA